MRLINGRKASDVAGRGERLLDERLRVIRVQITASFDNTGRVYVGGQNVMGLSGLETGYVLRAGEDLRLEGVDLADVWIDAPTAGDSVTWGAEVDD